MSKSYISIQSTLNQSGQVTEEIEAGWMVRKTILFLFLLLILNLLPGEKLFAFVIDPNF
jgi:hypothetical protein